MLTIKSLDVSYDKIQVIRDISLTLRGEEAVGIFGPNGAGKSTLIDTIIGLNKPDRGEIVFNGESLTGLETHQIVKKGIALVPQNRELFPLMTVEENLKLGAAYIPEAREKIEDNLESIFNIFPILKERRAQIAGTMSGGQRRMLTVGRALMADPRLLILDEPSVGLQPSLVTELTQKLNEIKKENVSILLTEQNVRQGLKVIDRGYVLENGKIAIEGAVESLADNDHVKKAYLGI